jgi:RNA polymerase sigma-70 factor (ECF subfamily)
MATDLQSLTDAELIARANTGDEAAMSEIYLRHREWVYAVAKSFCRNDADAQDFTHETFQYLFRQLPNFTLTSQLRTYLYPVVRNKVFDHQRRARREDLVDDPETLERLSQIGGTATSPEAAANFADLVALLPSEEHRQVVSLRFHEGLSLDEIATRLGIPPGTVKSRLHNALEKLRHLMALTILLQLMHR